MGAEIVLNECDLPGRRKMRVGQFLEDLREIHGGVAVGYLDTPPAFQRREHHEQIGRAIALILVVKACGSPWLGRDRHARFGDQLL